MKPPSARERALLVAVSDVVNAYFRSTTSDHQQRRSRADVLGAVDVLLGVAAGVLRSWRDEHSGEDDDSRAARHAMGREVWARWQSSSGVALSAIATEADTQRAWTRLFGMLSDLHDDDDSDDDDDNRGGN